MIVSNEVVTAVRRNAYRADQDWEDRVQDSLVWLLEHTGEYDTLEGDHVIVETDEHKIALGTKYMRGQIRDGRKRKIQDSLTNPITFSQAERASATKPTQTDPRADLAERLARLTVIQQSIARLMLAGLTQTEIAAKLQIKAGTLRKRLHAMRNVNQ